MHLQNCNIPSMEFSEAKSQNDCLSSPSFAGAALFCTLAAWTRCLPHFRRLLLHVSITFPSRFLPVLPCEAETSPGRGGCGDAACRQLHCRRRRCRSHQALRSSESLRKGLKMPQDVPMPIASEEALSGYLKEPLLNFFHVFPIFLKFSRVLLAGMA